MASPPSWARDGALRHGHVPTPKPWHPNPPLVLRRPASDLGTETRPSHLDFQTRRLQFPNTRLGAGPCAQPPHSASPTSLQPPVEIPTPTMSNPASPHGPAHGSGDDQFGRPATRLISPMVKFSSRSLVSLVPVLLALLCSWFVRCRWSLVVCWSFKVELPPRRTKEQKNRDKN